MIRIVSENIDFFYNISGLSMRAIKVAVAGIKYFARGKFLRRFTCKKGFGLVRILMLLREIGYHFWVLINSKKVTNDNYVRQLFLIGHNLKYVHMTYYFHELLIFFWLTLVNTLCLKYTNEILYVNTYFK